MTLPCRGLGPLRSRNPHEKPAVHYKGQHVVPPFYSPETMKTSDKAGRPKSSNPCTHCVMVRFDDLEYDALQRMMERAGETVKATFIKQVIADKPFKVRVTDKTLALYTAKLGEFFSQFRTLGVNYNIVVRELRAGFTEKKAMSLLYNLEKTTRDMIAIMAEVKELTEKFDEQWSQKSV